jgi:iron complex outermembrane receptor protein
MVDQGNTDGVYNTIGTPGLFGHYRSWGVTDEMNLDLGAVKLTSVTAYRESTDNMLQDFATAGLYAANRDQKYHQFSQELRASGKVGGGLDYVAGVYYFNSKYHIFQHTSVFGGPSSLQDTTGWSESIAGFLDLNWQIADKIRISGGGRLTHDSKSLSTSFNDPGNLAASFVGPKSSHNWSKFTPKIGVDYRPNNDLMFYASWSRGYRSGGFNGRGLTEYTATLPYDPETVDAYEVGVKSEFFDRKLVLNLAGFYSDYKSIQQTSTVAVPGIAVPQTVVINAAAAKIKGFEADMTLRPIDRLTIRGSFGYTDASFRGFVIDQPVAVSATDSIVRSFDFSGVDMIYAPEITASVNGEYTIPFQGRFNGEIKLNASYRYLSSYDQQIAADPAIYPEAISAPAGDTVVVPRNDPRLRSDRQNLVDLSASVIFDATPRTKVRVTGFARNLLDDRGTQTAFNAGSFPVTWAFATAREARVFGVQMGLEF